MADAFVSTTGTATYPGTKGSPTSLTSALGSVNAGDVVYIAPGVYRVQLTMTRTGTASQRIRIVGDPTNSQQISGAIGNVVRLTTFQNDISKPLSMFLIFNPSIDDGAICFHLLSSILYILHHLRLKNSRISEILPVNTSANIGFAIAGLTFKPSTFCSLFIFCKFIKLSNSKPCHRKAVYRS